jgi:hypothetical protein
MVGSGKVRGAQMKISYSAVWEDMMRMLRENARLLAAIAGVFFFLPALLIAQYLPPPETTDPDRVFRDLIEYYSNAWPWLLLHSLVSMIGGAAMLRLVLVRGTNVGAALGFGLMLLPFYFLLSLICGIIIGLGCLLLLVPGLYLFGRLAPAVAVMVAENRRNPIEAVSRSFQITTGNGWAVFGLVFIVGLVAGVVILVVTLLAGTIFALAAGQDLGGLLAAIVSSAMSAAFATLLLVLYAAIYRGLTRSDSIAATFE